MPVLDAPAVTGNDRSLLHVSRDQERRRQVLPDYTLIGLTGAVMRNARVGRETRRAGVKAIDVVHSLVHAPTALAGAYCQRRKET